MATTEPYCNHDPVAIKNGVCECGRMSFGDFMRVVLELFPNAQVSTDSLGEVAIHTGLVEEHDEGGNAFVVPARNPNLTGV